MDWNFFFQESQAARLFVIVYRCTKPNVERFLFVSWRNRHQTFKNPNKHFWTWNYCDKGRGGAVDVGGQCVRRATSARIFGHGIIFFKNPKRFRTLAFLDSNSTSVRVRCGRLSLSSRPPDSCLDGCRLHVSKCLCQDSLSCVGASMSCQCPSVSVRVSTAVPVVCLVVCAQNSTNK